MSGVCKQLIVVPTCNFMVVVRGVLNYLNHKIILKTHCQSLQDHRSMQN